MNLSPNPENPSSNVHKRGTAFFLFVLFLLLLTLILYQVYHLFERTQMEKLFNDNQNFAILVVAVDDNPQSQKPNSANEKVQKETVFISLVSIHPQTSRVGLISFFPDTRLKKNSPPLGQRLINEDIEVVKKDIALTMGIDIPFYIEVSISAVSRFVDLTEGIPYYIWHEAQEKQNLSSEKLPQGEFTLDGSLVHSLLQMPIVGKESLPERLYRQYSFMLNFWKVRDEKWKILSNNKLFYKALEGVRSNMPQSDLFFLSQVLMAEKNWLPFFMEVPVQEKEKGKLFMDAETGALFLKELQKKLVLTDEPLQEEFPRVQVRNGTTVSGLARKIRNRLAKKGFIVLEFSNADRNDYRNSLLIDKSANVNLVQNYSLLTGARYYFSVDRSLFVDIVVVVGEDYRELKF